MATAKRKVVSVVRRDGDPASATVNANGSAVPTVIHAKTARTRGKDTVVASRRAALKTAASASRKAAMKDIAPKQKQKRTLGNSRIKAIGVQPVVYKKDDGKPLEERLNDKLLAQLMTRKVTNKQAAEALQVSETYLSRVVASMQNKLPGQTTAARAAAAKLYKARIETREMLAKKVNKGEITLAKAAQDAHCSERTMFRYCAKYANLKK